MSKILVIPDVHLKPKMFDRAEKILESGQADFAVQLGDLFDDWGQAYNQSAYDETVQRVIEFHKKFPKTLWCMGNHDFGYYLPEYGRRESGHSEAQEGIMTANLIKMTEAGISQKVIHVVDDVIFSHAGLTEQYATLATLGKMGRDLNDNFEESVNLSEPDALWQLFSPIWARPQYTSEKMFSDKMQVVGHTPISAITLADKVLSTDVFSMRSDGSPIGEQRFAIIDTEKKEWQYAKDSARNDIQNKLNDGLGILEVMSRIRGRNL